MTFNPEEPSKITVRRFRGIQRGMDDGDVPIDQFLDARNLITDDKSGEARTRDGSLSVDNRIYNSPFAIMPGARGVVGLRGVDVTPRPGGKLQLIANPSAFEVDSSTSQAVTFVVYGGSDLAASPSYSWDYRWAPGLPADSDDSGSSATQTETYVNADVPANNQATIWCRVSMTGDDGKSYEAWAQLTITRKDSPVVTSDPPSPPPPPPPGGEAEVTISASPEEIALGDPATIGWDSLGCSAIALTGQGVSGQTALSGMKVVTPTAAGTYTYSITGTPEEGIDGTPADNCTLVVTPAETPPPDPEDEGGVEVSTYSVTLSANPDTYASGETMTLVATFMKHTETHYPDGKIDPAVTTIPDLALDGLVASLQMWDGEAASWDKADHSSATGNDSEGTVSANTITWDGYHYDLAADEESRDLRFRAFMDSETISDYVSVKVLSASSLVTITSAIVGGLSRVLTMDTFRVSLTADDTSFEDTVAWKDTWTLLSGNAAGSLQDGASAYNPTPILAAAYSDLACTSAVTMNADGTIPKSAWKSGDAGVVVLELSVDFPYRSAEPPDPVLYQNIQFFSNVTGETWKVTPCSVRIDCQSYFTIAVQDPGDHSTITDVYSDIPFEVVATLKDATGTNDTSYDGASVLINLVDADGNEIKSWSGTMSGATMTKSDCSATISQAIIDSGESVELHVRLVDDARIHEYQTAVLDPHAMVRSLVFTDEPAAVTRGVNFAITVEARDVFGQIISSADDTIEFTLSPSNANDVFMHPDDGETVVFTAQLVAGTATIISQAISGGSSSATASIAATADGYTGGSTETFAISDPAVITLADIRAFSALYTPATWEAARTSCDASAVYTNAGNAGYIHPKPAHIYNYYHLNRGGKKATGISGQTALTVSYSKNAEYGTCPTFNMQIRYSNTAPTTGASLRGGTLLTTIAVSAGQQGATGTVDGSAAINGNDDVYVWTIAEADYNNSGYPAGTQWIAGLYITNLEFS